MTLQDTLHNLISASDTLQQVLAEAAQHNIAVSLVGGALRDGLLYGRLSNDLDIVVERQFSAPLATALAHRFSSKVICLDERFDVYRVFRHETGEFVDVAACLAESIEADLWRRDYTINALAFECSSQSLLDPTGGLADLDSKTLRAICRDNLLDDPLRLIRAFRLMAEHGLKSLTSETAEMIRDLAPNILKSAVERIHYEILRLLSAEHAYDSVRLMADLGLLEVIFPELTPCRDVPANRYHQLMLFDHTLELLRQAEVHLPDFPAELQEHYRQSFNPTASNLAVVRLACLFHDIGKPDTMAYLPEADKYTFYTHEQVSETMTREIAERYKWGKDLTEAVCLLVRWHLYPDSVLRAEVTPRALRRFFHRLEAIVPEMILLALADRYSAQGPEVSAEELAQSKILTLGLWEKFLAHQADAPPSAKLLSGHDVMSITGLSPGPVLGKVMMQIQEAYLNNEISTSDDARAWLFKRYALSAER